MWLVTKKEIPQSDYNTLIKDQKKLYEYVGWRAKFSEYPPAGYGFMNPKVFYENKTYYCSWEHMNNCD